MTVGRTNRFCAVLALILTTAWLVSPGLSAEPAGRPAWTIEQGTDAPSYAVITPITTDLNIDVVVLACEETGANRVLQLQVYLTDEGPLRPKHLNAGMLKTDPHAVVGIDGRAFPIVLLFADDYAVLADAQDGPFPLLSDALIEAMQAGDRMALHFDLLEEKPGERPAFDSIAIVDLAAPGGRQAVAAMRRCADSPLLASKQWIANK